MAVYDQFKKLLSAGKFSEAADFAEKEMISNPSSQVFWLNQQIIALSRGGKYKTAAVLADRALALEPQNPYSLILRSDAYLHLGAVDKALTGYEEATRYFKVVNRARKGILECLTALKEWQRVLSCIAQWDLPHSDTINYRIKALSNLKQTDEAIALCEEWIQQSPSNKQALWLLVQLEIVRDGLEQVVCKYERIAKIPSKAPVYGEIYASLCRKTGRVDKALIQYEKLERKGQDLSISRQKAFTLAKTGHEQEAIPLLEELLRFNPTDIFLHRSYTSANNRIKTPERILKFYHELLCLFPEEKTLLGRIKKIKNKVENTEKKDSPQSAQKPVEQ